MSDGSPNESAFDRRFFVRGIAAAGASTVVAAGLSRVDRLAVLTEQAYAATKPLAFSEFNALAPATADRLQVPDGFRAQILLRYGDEFARGSQKLIYGYNNDFLAYFPLKGSSREGLLFVNHEYPNPFFQHGYKALAPIRAKTAGEVQMEQDAVGNSIVHLKRNANGRWGVVSPSPYNRRIYGDRPSLLFTGPLKGAAGIGDRANGSVGNCSGGITPWGTALSCEENYDGYGLRLAAGVDFAYGWSQYGDNTNSPDSEFQFAAGTFAKHGWVVEHDPYAPNSTPRKHTALGRFRHENTAFRHVKGRPFVLYMGDDKANEGVYKFVSTREFKPGDRMNNLRILEEGKLYIARWLPEGRRRFATAGDVTPISATSGVGEWVEVRIDELEDTATRLRARFGTDYDTYFATNRPEDVEVAKDGSVWIAMTNNSSVRDTHGSIRVLREASANPTAMTFTWEDYAAGGPTSAGGMGFSCPDNLAFDNKGGLWIVTDISSGTLNRTGPLQYHANNAMFYVPLGGANRGVGFRFVNAPVEAELTGPWFTPDQQTLFIAVQHPGEETANRAASDITKPETFSSWWPRGDRTAGLRPSTPLPATVAITRKS